MLQKNIYPLSYWPGVSPTVIFRAPQFSPFLWLPNFLRLHMNMIKTLALAAVIAMMAAACEKQATEEAAAPAVEETPVAEAAAPVEAAPATDAAAPMEAAPATDGAAPAAQ
jgi:hypothetical protein